MPEFPNKLILPLNLFEDRKTRRLFTPGSSIPVVSPPNNGIELGEWLNWAIETGIININNVYEVADLTARNDIEEPAQGDVAIIVDADGLTSPGLSWYNEGSWTTPFLGGNGIFSAANDGRDVAISSAELTGLFKFTTGVNEIRFQGNTISARTGPDTTTTHFILSPSAIVLSGDKDGTTRNSFSYNTLTNVAQVSAEGNTEFPPTSGVHFPAKMFTRTKTDRTVQEGGLYLYRQRETGTATNLAINDVIGTVGFLSETSSSTSDILTVRSGAAIRATATQNWTSAIRPAKLEFYVSRNLNEAGVRKALTINDDRSIVLDGYDSTNQIGVGTYALQTDATGKIVKAAISSGADGNGIFTAANSGGTIPTTFTALLTDTLTFGSGDATLIVNKTTDTIQQNTLNSLILLTDETGSARITQSGFPTDGLEFVTDVDAGDHEQVGMRIIDPNQGINGFIGSEPFQFTIRTTQGDSVQIHVNTDDSIKLFAGSDADLSPSDTLSNTVLDLSGNPAVANYFRDNSTIKTGIRYQGFPSSNTDFSSLVDDSLVPKALVASMIAAAGGSDGNGIFDAANTAGGATVPSGFEAQLTDTIAFTGGNVGIGTTSPSVLFELSNGDTGNSTSVTFKNYRDNIAGISFSNEKSRGSESSPTIVLDGDQISAWTFRGYDGSNSLKLAQIVPICRFDSSNLGGEIEFRTTTLGNSSGNPTASFLIKNTGQIQLNKYLGTTFDATPTKFLGVDGSGNIVKTSAVAANNIYTANGTIGSGRVATLTDTLAFTGGNVGIGETIPEGRLHVLANGFDNTSWIEIDPTGDPDDDSSAWPSLNLRTAMPSTNMVDGFGTGISFYIGDDTVSSSSIGALLVTRDGADNSGKLTINLRNAGVITDIFSLLKTGQLWLGAYGMNNFSGVETSMLFSDTNGNIIEGSSINTGSTETGVTINVPTTSVVNLIYYCDATSNNQTVNLPAASGWGDAEIKIVKIDSSVNTVTIDGNGAETIIGATTQVLNSQYESVILHTDGTEWFIW